MKGKRRGRDSNPWRGFQPPHRFSKPALSAAQPPLQHLKTSAFPAFLPLRLPTFTTVYTTARIWGCRSGQPVVTGLAAATVTHTFKECHHVRKSSYPTRQARQAPTRLPAHAAPGGLLVQTHS